MREGERDGRGESLHDEALLVAFIIECTISYFTWIGSTIDFIKFCIKELICSLFKESNVKILIAKFWRNGSMYANRIRSYDFIFVLDSVADTW